MKSLLLLLVLWSSSAFSQTSEDPRDQALKLLQDASHLTQLEDRLEYFSGKFITRPYGSNGPLGEGEIGRYDQDPLYRFDTFDCTTFVETVNSLARSVSLDQFETTMNHIRYHNGVVDYLQRKHFTAMQWVPQNIQDGFFLEANQLVLPAARIRVSTNTNDFGNWLKFKTTNDIQIHADDAIKAERLKELHGRASGYPIQDVSISYLPIRDLLAHPQSLQKIPSGSVVNFVRVNWNLADKIGTNLLVSHQGLVFQRGGVAYLRHASSGAEKRVVEVPFNDYLGKISPESTLKGIHLLQPIPR